MGEIQRRTVVTQWTYKTIQGVFPSAANRTTVLSVAAGGHQIIVDRIVAISTGASTPNVTVTLLKSGVTPANPAQDIVSAYACSANIPLQVWPPNGNVCGGSGEGLVLDAGDALQLLCSAVTVNYTINYRIEG